MEAHKRSLQEILSTDTRLVAPLFQRPYVWKQEANWEPLWQAVVEVAERRIGGSQHRPYFLGALVLDQVPNAVGTVTSREIIDGQQRMTTLQVLMEMAKRIFHERGWDHQKTQLHRVTRNEVETESDDRFKVWPTNRDRDEFREVMLEGRGRGLLGSCADFYRDAISAWLGSGDESGRARARALVEGLRQDIVFVTIDLHGDDDGQLIFETLNSLGTPLSPADLVKNLLFRQAQSEGINADDLYRKHWSQIERDDDYWRKAARVGRRERPQLDIFLQSYLTLRLLREASVSHLFREYRDAFHERSFGETEQALADFVRLANSYRLFETSVQMNATGNLRKMLEVLDTAVPYPLVLGILVNVDDPEEQARMLNVIESYLVRRFLCGYQTKAYNRIVVDLLQQLNAEGWTVRTLRTKLLAMEGNSAVWPEDEAVVARLVQKNSYGDLRAYTLAHLLGCYEASLRDGFTEQHHNTRTPLTLEHIMPRNWRKNWTLPSESNEAEERREEMINKLGNLTIITQKLNSSLSDAPWNKKKLALNQHSVLLVNRDLTLRDNWDETGIEERTWHLAKAFCTLWPRG